MDNTYGYDSSSSQSSSSGCFHLGEFGQHAQCESWNCEITTYGLYCKDITDASQARLCQLPMYIADRRTEVRQAAKARFIELQNPMGN